MRIARFKKGAQPSRWVKIDRKPVFLDFVDLLNDQEVVAADTETTGLIWYRSEIVGMSFSFDEVHAPSVFAPLQDGRVDVYIPIRHETGEKQLDPEFVLSHLSPFLENPDTDTLWHNAKYDLLMYRRDGIIIRGHAYDTLGLHTILDEQGSHKLGDLAHRLLGAPPWKDEIREYLAIEAKKRKCKIDDLHYGHVHTDVMTPYACQDTRYTWRLFWEYIDQIHDNEGFDYLFYDVEEPLTHALVRMEYEGALVDLDYLAELSEEYETKTNEIFDRIQDAAAEFIESRSKLKELRRNLRQLKKDLKINIANGGPTKRIQNSIASTKRKIDEASILNLNSPQQLRRFFEYEGFPNIKKTKSGLRSTDKLVLMRLAATGKYPVAEDMLEYRKYGKVLTTYALGLPQWADDNHRIHTSFNQFGPRSGRLSSSDPNLQNIPRGPVIRRAFIVPGDGEYVFISIDFSQIELRLAAHYSGDVNMIEIYANNGDIHQKTADSLGCPSRQDAKPINFGLLYGMGPYSLIDNAFKDYGIVYSKSQAKRYHRLFWHKAYPGLHKWVRRETRKIKQREYSETFFGRRRHAPGINNKARPKWQREKDVRSLINHIIQGTGADMLKIASVRVDRFLNRPGIRTTPVLNIHDELDFYWHRDELNLLPEVIEIMEDWDHCGFKVPITVGVSYSSKSWGDKKEIEVH